MGPQDFRVFVFYSVSSVKVTAPLKFCSLWNYCGCEAGIKKKDNIQIEWTIIVYDWTKLLRSAAT